MTGVRSYNSVGRVWCFITLKVAGSNPAESTIVITDFKRLIHALLAQSVERRPFKPVVVGSNPTEGAIPGYPSGQRG